MSSERSSWKIKASRTAKQAHNPIRAIVDKLKVDPNATKPLISLSIGNNKKQKVTFTDVSFPGDPTIFGNFNVDSSINEAVIKQINGYRANGYPPADGTFDSRSAIAKTHSHPSAPLTANDVILANGCSGALEMCVNALCDEGTNILLPRPGFSLYGSLAATRFVEARYYNLVPEKNWEADLEHLESLIDEKTSAILVNNPSNPCGSVYSREHLEAILKVAEKHHVPIIADEIYCDLVFKGNTFHPMATLTDSVPILSVGGLAKKWLVPGWRVGWILIHDRNGVFAEIHEGLHQLAQIILGPNSLIQAALPDILEKTPASFYESTIQQIQDNVDLSMNVIGRIEGLKPVTPQGAMYMMVGIEVEKFRDIESDVDFSAKLLAEENVICLPGECFKYPNFVRFVITPTMDRLEEAYKRIEEFCSRHRK
ncbi:tyrosine aminotransferase [Rhizopus delemar RA 99-880]|uniref:Tyrosine aminotransferase n=1 Tax=Rhizopus delemar (strain RA 99-880 / ATCC MYA-4621 / FGSC 9543 / NRRL 43880) TaxID=246409 RepID=I1CEN0_RHIO9|nr:tyrosine aminotransferase [Rhizopus delemar RA 99-880]|eukprot:EIE86910.1 tyrosine aminotransferase [Rhizopus delemar RA 99-880]